MTALLLRIGTLALLVAAFAPAGVSERYRYYRSEPRSEIRDQRPQSRSEDVFCPMCDRPAARFHSRRETTIHGPNYCYFCERTPSGRIRRNASVRRALKDLHPCPRRAFLPARVRAM
jgi:hypothetical protein